MNNTPLVTDSIINNVVRQLAEMETISAANVRSLLLSLREDCQEASAARIAELEAQLQRMNAQEQEPTS